jgi:2-oxoacid:acceptor oxidoreductase gamma subunit (pyruvate/2-ketoisovalerate family)
MIQIKMYGLGGQGVVTAARILVEAVVIQENRYAKSLPAYGHERRGAPIHADVMIADAPILLNTFVYQPDIIMVFDPGILSKGIDILAGVHRNSLLVFNCSRELGNEASPACIPIDVLKNFKHTYHLNASRIAQDCIQRNIPNSAMLGALSQTGVVSIEAVTTVLNQFFGNQAGVMNARAARKAYEQTRRT